MPERKIVLFRFDVPEVAHLPPDEKERILELCWRSVPVQQAWKHYWSRPFQLLLIPIIPMAVYFNVANESTGMELAIILPFAVIFVFVVRAFYRKRLTVVLRQAASAALRGEQLKIDETVPTISGSVSEPAVAGTESARFDWKEHRGKLILTGVLWILIITLLFLLPYLKRKGY